MNGPTTAREVMARRYEQPDADSRCEQHASLPVWRRPRGCDVCLVELQDAFRRGQAYAEWLNRWRDDALEVLARQDAALVSLQGWEVRHLLRSPGGAVDLAREDVHGETETLLEFIPEGQAQLLVAFLERVAAQADGVVPILNVEGGKADGAG